MLARLILQLYKNAEMRSCQEIVLKRKIYTILKPLTQFAVTDKKANGHDK